MATQTTVESAATLQNVPPLSEDGGLGQEFTKHVVTSFGPKTDPRLREVMGSFVQHIHDFAREVNLTVDEWLAGVEMINQAGQMSNERRNEGQLMCDVIGLETLVDDITHRKHAAAGNSGTLTAILGPFWRADTPTRPNGTTISFDTPKDGIVSYLYGTITCADTGKPLPNASVEVWQASTNGLYEQQDADQQDCNLRGKFITDDQGRFSFYCLKPTPYPIPEDGPAGKLLRMLDRHFYRPAHLHFMVIADGFKSVTTQIFDSDSDYLGNDTVFAVKDGLTVTFLPRKGDPQAEWELEFNMSLAKKKDTA
ncbi:Intradiol ring-cleavage dioxygenase [Dactylonectria estremocensis]|uniref:Intradiol ring-cleavage dioxygenase n=1 Tax=Dactylonectria estremocensis TaxID=1079267 RepID=A0A9P9EDJ6_9HYPO|nr:Intradiol ring-cleavage dioxygenase [Dactylonectria estremocensis]